MTHLDELDAILNIPRRHYQGNASISCCFLRTHYAESPTEITESMIRKALIDNPKYLKDWKIFSDDKKTYGWHMDHHKPTQWVVFFLESLSAEPTRATHYLDEASATAAYIKREIENWKIRSENPGFRDSSYDNFDSDEDFWFGTSNEV